MDLSCIVGQLVKNVLFQDGKEDKVSFRRCRGHHLLPFAGNRDVRCLGEPAAWPYTEVIPI